jgi:twitching motility protein PilT
MDAKDRSFADIAVRLQLLTREQANSCVEQTERAEGKRIDEVAVDLGFISRDEAELVRAQQARALDRQRAPRGGAAGSSALVEERVRKTDPRADSSPVAASSRSAAPARKRRGPRTWEVPTHPAQGLMHVPHTAAEAPGTVPDASDASPTTTFARPALHELQELDTVPLRKTPEPAVPKRAAAVSGFPLAQGGEAALFSDAPPAPPSPAPAVAPPIAAASATLMQPLVAPRAAAEPAPVGTTLPAFSAVRGQTVPLGSAAPAPPPAPAPAHTPTLRPPKAVEQRPSSGVATADSYLGKALALAQRQAASDLHVHSGAPMLMRVDGQIRPLSGTSVLSAEAAEKVIAEITTDAQWTVLSKKGEVDFAYEIPGLGRYRVNVYRQQRGLDAVFRLIALRPPTLEELGLPARLSRLMDFRTGMVLCTGPAGCGKSTTLAALLSTLTQSRQEHVLTIEDPVEYVYPQARALVNQRQVRDHTSSFSRALRAALHEDPDVIAITDLRDRETIGLAISAAETGHLVLGSLHTGNAAQTINRIVSSFAADEQEQVRAMLAESLRAVISQRLVPTASGKGRVPAVELLMVNTAVSNLIREDKTHQLPSVMQTGKAAGMLTLDDSLDELVRAGTVSSETARRFAVRKERFT